MHSNTINTVNDSVEQSDRQRCFVCGGAISKHIEENGYTILQCKLCRCGLTKRRINDAALYEQQYLDFLGKPACSWINETFTLQQRVRTIERLKSGGTILDFGCGPGNTLALFNPQRWDRFGLDISKESCQIAREKGLRVECVDLEKTTSAEEAFDVIMANHVLEHLDDPESALKKLVRLLKAGGILYIEVPNFSSLGSEMFKGKWPGVDSAHHNYHFTKQGARLLLERNGLRALNDTTPKAKDIFFSLFLGRMMMRDFPDTRMRYILSLPRIVLSLLGRRSEMLVFICQKQRG